MITAVLRTFECNTTGDEEGVAVVVGSDCNLQQALDFLGLKNGAVLGLVGGAGSMDLNVGGHSLRDFFVDVLAPLAETLQAIVIDGGTDSGVMKLMGSARSEIQGTFPLVGVAAMGTVDLSARTGKYLDNVLLEPRHSHFVIVPGDRWGDESPWIARIASTLSNGFKSLTVVVNGGDITLRDISCSIREGRPVLVMSGSGRAADRVAAGLDGRTTDPEIKALVSSDLIHALDINIGSAELNQALCNWMTE